MAKKFPITIIWLFLLVACVDSPLSSGSPHETHPINVIPTETITENQLPYKSNKEIQSTSATLPININPIAPSHTPTTASTAKTDTQTLVASSSTRSNSSELSGKIYAWSPISQRGALYGYFDPSTDIGDWNILLPARNDLPGANHAIALAFSRYSGQVAYLVGNQKPELWIADLAQINAERVWVDVNGWLGDIEGFPDVRIIWGIDDRYVIVSSHRNENHIVIYDLTMKRIELLIGGCNIVAKSPNGNYFVVWCKNLLDQTQSYMALEKSGMIWSEQAPNKGIITIDWAYSQDGERLLFANDSRDIYLTMNRSELRKLPAKYKSLEWIDIVMKNNLKWSYDGNKVLIYAYGEPANLCPPIRAYATTNELRDRPCWLIINSNDGELFWKPDEGISQSIDVTWEYLSNEFDATLSLDGEWLATTFADIRIGHLFFLVVTSTNEDFTKVISPESPLYLQWVEGD